MDERNDAKSASFAFWLCSGDCVRNSRLDSLRGTLTVTAAVASFNVSSSTAALASPQSACSSREAASAVQRQLNQGSLQYFEADGGNGSFLDVLNRMWATGSIKLHTVTVESSDPRTKKTVCEALVDISPNMNGLRLFARSQKDQALAVATLQGAGLLTGHGSYRLNFSAQPTANGLSNVYRVAASQSLEIGIALTGVFQKLSEHENLAGATAARTALPIPVVTYGSIDVPRVWRFDIAGLRLGVSCASASAYFQGEGYDVGFQNSRNANTAYKNHQRIVYRCVPSPAGEVTGSIEFEAESAVATPTEMKTQLIKKYGLPNYDGSSGKYPQMVWGALQGPGDNPASYSIIGDAAPTPALVYHVLEPGLGEQYSLTLDAGSAWVDAQAQAVAKQRADQIHGTSKPVF